MIYEIVLGILYALAIFISLLAYDSWELAINPSPKTWIVPSILWLIAFCLTFWWM